MTLGALLDLMFPGDAARGMPCFSDLCRDVTGFLDPSTSSRLSAMVDDLEISETKDINTLLRDLRQEESELMTGFIESALAAYFSAPSVIEAANGTPATLFPNARVLPDSDYTLLEPVYQRNSLGGSDEG